MIAATVCALNLCLVPLVFAEDPIACNSECPEGQRKISFTNGGDVDCFCTADPGEMPDDTSVQYGGSEPEEG